MYLVLHSLRTLRVGDGLHETSGSELGSVSMEQLLWIPYCICVKGKVGHQAGRSLASKTLS